MKFPVKVVIEYVEEGEGVDEEYKQFLKDQPYEAIQMAIEMLETGPTNTCVFIDNQEVVVPVIGEVT